MRKTSNMSSPVPPLIVAGNETPLVSQPRVVSKKFASNTVARQSEPGSSRRAVVAGQELAD